ncbi:hypothetical protein [Flammeovirga sp. OC4]|uniref:helix-turn-helix transcriptional regulator n=1 Tax=Flammeovirga sp. OC4 TaxID=1382345 RepID=UPI0005C63224|nr:hypothetical protein [Flammeovirga sp. OC4]
MTKPQRICNNEFIIIEIKHRILEMWKMGYSISETADVLQLSKSSIDKYRKNIKDEMEFETNLMFHKSFAQCTITYSDYVIEQIKR